jgi:hypothetical protein
MPNMGTNTHANFPAHKQEVSRRLLGLIVVRAVVLLLGLNLAAQLSFLPDHLGPYSFLVLFNGLALSITILSLILWSIRGKEMIQLYFQIGMDLIVTTILVAYTRGIESPFVFFYLLIIVYCTLILGRNGGMVGAALSMISYAGTILAVQLEFQSIGVHYVDSSQAIFRISAPGSLSPSSAADH